MSFYWAGLIFWLLIGVSLFLFIRGLWNTSWRSLLISGIALILPSLYFFGANNGFRLLVLLPVTPLLLAYYAKKESI